MRRPFLTLLTLFSVALSWATPAGAGAGPVEVAKAGERHMEVVQVEGAIDPVVADLVKGSLRRAQTNGASLVILQIDSEGALDTDSVDLVDAVQLSKVPVAAWIGPGKSSARGAAAAVVAAASFAAASPGARLGPVDPPRLDGRRSSVFLHEFPGTPPLVGIRAFARLGALANRRYSGTKAAEAGLIDAVAPTLGDLIVALNGKEVPTAAGPVRLSTAKQVDTKAGALFGSSHLPVNLWALGLLLLSTLGFAVDVQAGHQGFWTGVGAVGLLVGALKLFGGSTALDVPLWLVGLIFVGQIIFMLGGMTVAVRNRFSIPTVGRDSMIGEPGEARTDLDPDGVVTVRGAPWRARTGRNRPVTAGGPIRVVAVDRLVLEVEPGDAAAEV